MYSCGFFKEGEGRAGFLKMPSSDGLRNLATSRPESACSLSRDGEGLSDLEGVVVGKGSLEAGRGIPLGRVGVLGCLSIAHYFCCIPEIDYRCLDRIGG